MKDRESGLFCITVEVEVLFSILRRELIIIFSPICFLGFLRVGVFWLMFVLINLKVYCNICPWIII